MYGLGKWVIGFGIWFVGKMFVGFLFVYWLKVF